LQSGVLSLARFLFINLIAIETIVAAISYLPSDLFYDPQLPHVKLWIPTVISIQVKPISAPLPPYKDKVCEK